MNTRSVTLSHIHIYMNKQPGETYHEIGKARKFFLIIVIALAEDFHVVEQHSVCLRVGRTNVSPSIKTLSATKSLSIGRRLALIAKVTKASVRARVRTRVARTHRRALCY